MRIILAALGAAFLSLAFVTPALAECVTRQRVATYIKAGNPEADRVAELSGPGAARFLVRWNAIPPITSLSADLVWVYYARSKSTVLIVLFDHGCLSAVDEQPKTLFRRLFPDVLLMKGQVT